MTEPLAHPHLRAMLTQLLQLDETEARLPLAILINLHRTQLRAPFEGMLQFADSHRQSGYASGDARANALEVALTKRYPSLKFGKLFSHESRLADLEVNLDLPYVGAGCPALMERGSLVESLLEEQEMGWRIYEPVLLLHKLTWKIDNKAQFELGVRMLDLELSLDPAVGQILLDMAAVPVERMLLL